MIKLNLGAGEIPIEGYEPRDAKRGDTLMPLPDTDASVDEIRASHVLEHFPFGATQKILVEWMRILKPGGVMKIAVPDFAIIARAYLDGQKFPVQGVVMGGQIDNHDFHHALFDEENLREVMHKVGLRGIRRWKSEIADAAASNISLNLQGTKPSGKRPSVGAVMSVPRLGYMVNANCVYQLGLMGIVTRKFGGAYWGQCLTRAIEETIAEQAPDYVLSIDYDSVFGRNEIEALFDLALQHPEADVLAPLQAHRGHGRPLLFIRGSDNRGLGQIDRAAMQDDLLPVESAHFGLTLIKASALASMPRPWFIGTPDADGRWTDAKTDDDIHFWRQCVIAGLKVFVTPRVVIGHLVERIMWPDINLDPLYQDSNEYFKTGTPEAVWK